MCKSRGTTTECIGTVIRRLCRCALSQTGGEGIDTFYPVIVSADSKKFSKQGNRYVLEIFGLIFLTCSEKVRTGLT